MKPASEKKDAVIGLVIGWMVVAGLFYLGIWLRFLVS
jgi:hypothetical protein